MTARPTWRTRAHARAGLLAVVACALAAGCAATTYDASVTTLAAADTTTSTRPSGTTSELLAGLVAESTTLSAAIAEGGDARATLERIEALWEAARPQVGASRPELLDPFERSIAMCRTAVDRRRPADADKAAMNIDVLARALA